MDDSLFHAPLPNVSILTGNVRASSAATCLASALIDMQRTWKHQKSPGTSIGDSWVIPVSVTQRLKYEDDRKPCTSVIEVQKPMAGKAQPIVESVQETPARKSENLKLDGLPDNKLTATNHLTAANLETYRNAGKGGRDKPPRIFSTPRSQSSSVLSRSWNGPLSQHLTTGLSARSRFSTVSEKLRQTTPIRRPASMGAIRPHTSQDSWTNEKSKLSRMLSDPRSFAPNTEKVIPGSHQASLRQIVGTTSVRGSNTASFRPKPTAGTIYSIFQDIDKFCQGRVTYSAFEEAAMMIGLREEQIRRFFALIDTGGKGFFTIKEWGSPDIEHHLSRFAALFIAKTRGDEGRYKGAKEVDSLFAAIQMVLSKLNLKSSGRSVSHEALLRSFQFIDRDGSGSLDKQEVMDAFNGLGVYIKPHVLDEAMVAFDKDGDGRVDYTEFICFLFPNLSKGYKVVT